MGGGSVEPAELERLSSKSSTACMPRPPARLTPPSIAKARTWPCAREPRSVRPRRSNQDPRRTASGAVSKFAVRASTTSHFSSSWTTKSESEGGGTVAWTAREVGRDAPFDAEWVATSASDRLIVPARVCCEGTTLQGADDVAVQDRVSLSSACGDIALGLPEQTLFSFDNGTVETRD